MPNLPIPSTTTSPDRIVVRHTASSILAKFLPNQRTHHKMEAAGRSLRERALEQPSYAETDVSEDSSLPSTPIITSRADIQLGDELEAADEDEILYADRKSPAGHSLRPRQSLSLSLKASENGDKKATPISSVSRTSMCFQTRFVLTTPTSSPLRSRHVKLLMLSHSMTRTILP